MDDPLQRRLTWSRGPDSETIYVAEVEGRRWAIRLGEFPVEPLYTLLVDGAAVLSFDDWPPAWRRPAPSALGA